MTTRKVTTLGILALIGVLAFSADSQAGLLRKKKGNNCNTCAAPAQQSCCGGAVATAAPSCCGAGGYAVAPGGGVPLAMPMPGGSNVIPATGTIPASGAVIPSGGIVTNGGNVVPASGMVYNPATGGYYYPSNYSMPGMYQGADGNYYYSNTYSNTYSTPRRGLFRRY
jgi:hypothetical protein